MTGRYRKLYRQFLIPQNLTLPLVISENGIDNSPWGSPNFGGFNKYCDWWAQQGYGSDCAHVSSAVCGEGRAFDPSMHLYPDTAPPHRPRFTSTSSPGTIRR